MAHGTPSSKTLSIRCGKTDLQDQKHQVEDPDSKGSVHLTRRCLFRQRQCHRSRRPAVRANLAHVAVGAAINHEEAFGAYGRRILRCVENLLKQNQQADVLEATQGHGPTREERSVPHPSETTPSMTSCSAIGPDIDWDSLYVVDQKKIFSYPFLGITVVQMVQTSVRHSGSRFSTLPLIVDL
jgi:hypothetical protein